MTSTVWLHSATTVEYFEQSLDGGGIGEVRDDPVVAGIGVRAPKLGDRILHRLLGAPVHDDVCAFGGEPPCDGGTDAAGRSADEGRLASKLQVHVVSLRRRCADLLAQASHPRPVHLLKQVE